MTSRPYGMGLLYTPCIGEPSDISGLELFLRAENCHKKEGIRLIMELAHSNQAYADRCEESIENVVLESKTYTYTHIHIHNMYISE